MKMVIVRDAPRSFVLRMRKELLEFPMPKNAVTTPSPAAAPAFQSRRPRACDF
jgi:hypothetical protein